MKKLLFILTFLFPLFTKAQTDSVVKDSTPFECVFPEIWEEPPFYPGGEAVMMKFIRDNLVYPDSAYKNGLEGKVMVEFIVEPDSSVTNVKAIKTFDEPCAREAERIVGLMKWNPGTQNYQPVRTKMIMPIRFKIN
jgi:periplasmic protein TonB